jgi:DNA-binding response OmpR family regulator
MPTILLVDDDAEYRDLMALALEDRGFRVLTESAAEDALYRLSLHAVDAAVIDIRLPGLDGAALAEELRRRSTMPIVAVSGADEAGGAAARRSGADVFLAKPTRADELAETLRRLLGDAARRAPAWLQAGDLRVHRRHRRVQIKGSEVDLSYDEHRLLLVLMEPPLQPRTSELLADRLADDDVPDPDRVEAGIAALRRRLERRGASSRVAGDPGDTYRLEP